MIVLFNISRIRYFLFISYYCYNSRCVFSVVGPKYARSSALRKSVLKNIATIGTMISFIDPSNADQSVLSPRELLQQGMSRFRTGDVSGSLESFDKAIDRNPEVAKFSWQRGISLFYLRRYEECNAQFRNDVAMNPSDSEEVLWAFMCDSKQYGSDNARKMMLELSKADSRPIMRAIYDTFKGLGKSDIASLLKVGESYGTNSAEFFYSRLYASMLLDAIDDSRKSKMLMREASDSFYGRTSQDYMAAVARVYLQD